MEGKCSIGPEGPVSWGAGQGRPSPLPKGYPHVWPSEMTGPGRAERPGEAERPGRAE